MYWPGIARGSRRISGRRRQCHSSQAARKNILSGHYSEMGHHGFAGALQVALGGYSGKAPAKRWFGGASRCPRPGKIALEFFNAWPSKWTGPTLNAKGNDVAIEELTLTCERQEQVL